LDGVEEMPRLLGTLHAAEHAMIALLPLWAMCDRWDIGGLSTNIHPQTGRPTVFIYDGHAGGVGITERGFEQFEGWVRDTEALLRGCPCHDGCPSCVQSPKCGNLNDMLDKHGAQTFLERLVDFGGSRSPRRRKRSGASISSRPTTSMRRSRSPRASPGPGPVPSKSARWSSTDGPRARLPRRVGSRPRLADRLPRRLRSRRGGRPGGV